MMPAAIYIRSARRNPLSMWKQQESCEDYAHSLGADPQMIYGDVGRTREGLRMLTDDVTAGKIDAVFVTDLYRLGRKLEDFREVTDAIREAGCPIYEAGPRRLVSWDTPAGRLSIGISYHLGFTEPFAEQEEAAQIES